MNTFILTILLLAVVMTIAGLNRRCREAQRAEWGVAWLNWLDGFNRLFCHVYHRLPEIELRLPQTDGAIVVSNHISGLDPLLMLASSHRPLRFLIAREQYERFGLQWLFRAVGCIPVDRENSPEKAMRQAIKALRDGEIVALFPHGKIHLDSDPPRKIKAGAARLAALTGLPLVPLRITGVSGQGGVMMPVFMRGHAQIHPLPVIEATGQSPDSLNQAIQCALDQIPRC
ncbi:MAG: 1-acyl-sn-glycerol-3-phosphate acyltransferase [Candidatus Thiodiazotropha endolucinida]|nr:1-acyl-sn-glycerol-3-phosphate acyltransferase [Candidatus Thiodiazotropha taylori]MCG8094840.1 1-acyl-sn-glycerol-3-phosphate acyltransferase [Candidatus Thiodiazotropha endolucinida]MCG8060354.1 1-acyl-sn-glycerol-3-phosphate acyltransferase [Candidatus Thiodiazotropha taylori]MCG8065396.1 1-acyl-sn-glycerol-3-phosphate acyltransferase [Candidatus Thiodiazotropha taylori]MCW4331489.1 1-acyl-sn-glycerol-3-phosphate acyltransferase [Candidatus Thiodiazotropha endolucinida]